MMLSFSTKGCKESVNMEIIKGYIKELREDGHLASVNVQIMSHSQDVSFFMFYFTVWLRVAKQRYMLRDESAMQQILQLFANL